MSKPANKTVIGLFVVVALALVVVAVLIVGSGKFFTDNPKVVMYFKGSVKGLSVGSPVAFRGVKVGTVTEIKMFFDPKDLSVLIPVYAEFERGSLEAVPGAAKMEAYTKSLGAKGFMTQLVGQGMRAQLDMQSIVTGQLMIALDFSPDKPATLVGADQRYPEIPTIPTTLQQLAERVEKIPIAEIVAKLNSVAEGIDKIVNSPETAGILQKLNASATGMEKIVNSPEIAGTIKTIRQTVDDTRSLVQNLDNQVNPVAGKMTEVATRIDKLAERLEGQIGPLASSVTKTSDEAAVTLKKAQATMGTIDELAGEDSITSYRLGKTLEELSSAARAMRHLADTIQHQPDALIFGKKNTGGK
jgi:paraquat-inducible protein B